jgi:chromosome segregation protein
MRIKQLDIIGFKSFPDKCRIEFPPGVSAVVGPNGCGKSNIIDAIKWVMGEQSIRQLRGKSMGDVIFAGTSKRSPVNMAEVSLTLSSDGAVPLDGMEAYTEVMITRRIYRSGESEYLLNRRPCRLKDILGMVLSSGMGSKSCAIVQQGNIGAITDATPEERRNYIEEAAGVSRYKIRKNEAVAKVNAAGQNLLRLNDIIDEIKKNMNSLSRQAARARRFQELREACRRADALVSVYYHEKYSTQIQAALELGHNFKEKEVFYAEQLETLMESLEKRNAERSRKDADIDRKRSFLNENQREIDRIETELTHMCSEEVRLSAEIGELEAALVHLEEKNRRITSEMVQESQKIVHQESRIIEIRAAIEQESENVRLAKGRKAALETETETAKKRLFSLMTRKTRMEDILTHARSNQATIRQRLRRLAEEKERSFRQLSELEGKRAAAAASLEEHTAGRSALEGRIVRTKTELDRQISSLSLQIKEVTSLENDRNKARSAYSTLKKMDDNHEWYKDGVKALMRQQMTASSRPDHGGTPGAADIVGIVGDVIEPEAGYELAVEAVLGEALHYVLVHNPGAGIAAIAYLKENNAGRSGFIRVSPVSNTPEHHRAASTAAAANPLLNHVHILPEYEASVRALMDGAVVVDNFSAAVDLWRADNGLPNIVSRDGDLITRSGIMIGGSRDKLSGIFEKKRELKELGRTMATLAITLEAALESRKQLEETVKSLENDISGFTVGKNNMERKILDGEKQLYTLDETLKHTRYQDDVIRLETEKLRGEQSEVEDALTRHDEALTGINSETAAHETLLGDLTSKMADETARLTEIDRNQMDLKLELTRLTAERDSTGRTLERLKIFAADGATQISRIQEDIAIKTAKKIETVHLISDMETALGNRRNRIKMMNQEVKAGENDLSMLVSRIREISNEIEQIRKSLADIKDKNHQLELELSRFQLQRDNVVNRFLERYAESFDHLVSNQREMVHAPDFSIEAQEAALSDCQKKIDQIGDVNLGAIEFFEEQKQRHDFLVQQKNDLVEALEDLQRVIRKINRISQQLFLDMFDKINEKFKTLFPKLFPGGEAWLELTEADSPMDTGVELMIHPPGKKLSRLSLLSGGEKALSAIAFIFSLFLINPSSYCLLDEIDAPLDDANIFRFNELLKIIGKNAQIIMITHNKRSMEFSDVLFGVTMGESGVSRIVSVDIGKAADTETSPDETENKLKAGDAMPTYYDSSAAMTTPIQI